MEWPELLIVRAHYFDFCFLATRCGAQGSLQQGSGKRMWFRESNPGCLRARQASCLLCCCSVTHPVTSDREKGRGWERTTLISGSSWMLSVLSGFRSCFP